MKRKKLLNLGCALFLLLTACAHQNVTVSVKAAAETEPVGSRGDAADDPAIIIHPKDPAKSVIVGTNKNYIDGGLNVYSLDGKKIDGVIDPNINNVDVRPDFPFSDGPGLLIAGSRRQDSTIALYTYNWDTQKLKKVEAAPLKTIEAYGLCMGYNPKDATFYVYVNDKNGRIEQWEITPAPNGLAKGELVRLLTVPTQPEGCVVDDETGHIFVGEEMRGIWKFGAWPGGDLRGMLIDTVMKKGGPLTADVEGLSLYKKANGAGYLVASSQGSNTYALYDRQAPHAFVGTFSVVDGEFIDGTSETDGLDVTSVALGEKYPQGIVVVQDGHNKTRRTTQNFKIISWEDIQKGL